MDDDEGDGTRNDNVAKEWKSVRMASDTFSKNVSDTFKDT